MVRKAVILAGGLGTRLSEETSLKPKPMVEIGGMPILWHVMKIYSAHGINEFIICCGYKGYVINGTDPVLRTPDSVTNTQSSKVRRWEQNDTQTHSNWRQSAR